MYKVEVLGKIQAKERPRFNKRTGGVYTPQATKDSEALIRRCWESLKYPNLEGAVMVEINHYRSVPKSFKKSQRELALSGKLKPYESLGDIDNLAKTVLDGLNGAAYNDDRQVCGLIVWDLYGEENKTVIKVSQL